LCFISCYVYYKILEGNDDYVLILEDDIWFDENFDKILKEALNVLNNNYDVLFLGYHTKKINRI
jgi:GR25 family glycosyltransferase involved in LPS biosynthesis